VTVVYLARAADATWWVTRSATADIVVTSPVAGALVTSPTHLAGRSVAFEGVVNVQVRDDIAAQPLVNTTVSGGATGMGPFSARVSFSTPASSYGDLVLYERSAKDGSVTCATVLRLRF
jgi:hypothetical protein